MNRIKLISLSVLLFMISATVSAQISQVTVAYVNTTDLLNAFPAKEAATQKLLALSENYKKELELMQNEYNKKYSDYITYQGSLAENIKLRRMQELGLNPVGLLLAFERRTAQLAQLAGKLPPRGSVQALIDAESAARRVFWKDKRDLSDQLGLWRGKRLERLTHRLMALHATLMTHNQQAELLLSQELAEIARAAAGVKSKR